MERPFALAWTAKPGGASSSFFSTPSFFLAPLEDDLGMRILGLERLLIFLSFADVDVIAFASASVSVSASALSPEDETSSSFFSSAASFFSSEASFFSAPLDLDLGMRSFFLDRLLVLPGLRVVVASASASVSASVSAPALADSSLGSLESSSPSLSASAGISSSAPSFFLAPFDRDLGILSFFLERLLVLLDLIGVAASAFASASACASVSASGSLAGSLAASSSSLTAGVSSLSSLLPASLRALPR
mmetsp:Transcript_12108/g.26232  ORF Transcript_12108/g.26232 Transcript_12108/m.26232 type:complete len:248 (-) Transcript_12108:1551-2294(-)